MHKDTWLGEKAVEEHINWFRAWLGFTISCIGHLVCLSDVDISVMHSFLPPSFLLPCQTQCKEVSLHTNSGPEQYPCPAAKVTTGSQWEERMAQYELLICGAAIVNGPVYTTHFGKMAKKLSTEKPNNAGHLAKRRTTRERRKRKPSGTCIRASCAQHCHKRMATGSTITVPL